MSPVTISVDSDVMWKTAERLCIKLERDSFGLEILNLTEKEYGEEYGCLVGEQQFENGIKINRRDLTFKSESQATLFLLRWT